MPIKSKKTEGDMALRKGESPENLPLFLNPFIHSINDLYQLGYALLDEGARNWIFLMMKKLIESCAKSHGDINAITILITTAIHLGDLELLHTLIATEICPINTVLENGNSFLHLAVEIGDKKTLSLFMTHIDAKNIAGETPLHVAIRKGRLDVIQYLLEHHPNVALTNNDGKNSLHYALIYTHLPIETLACLIPTASIQPPIRIENALSLLMTYFIQTNELDLLDLLLTQYKESLHLALNHDTLWVNEAIQLKIQTSDMLLKSAASATKQLVIAASPDNTPLILELNPNIPSKATPGFYPIHIAAQNGDAEAVEKLITLLGCDPKLRTRPALTASKSTFWSQNTSTNALEIALKNRHFNVVNVLLKYSIEHHVTLENRNIGSVELFAFCEGLEKNTHLKTLDLSNNPLGPKGALHLLKILKKNRSLGSIHLQNTGLSETTITHIAHLTEIIHLYRLVADGPLANSAPAEGFIYQLDILLSHPSAELDSDLQVCLSNFETHCQASKINIPTELKATINHLAISTQTQSHEGVRNRLGNTPL